MKFMLLMLTSSLFVTCCTSFVSAQEAGSPPVKKRLVAPKVTLTADRESALYTCNDTAVFIATVFSEGQLADSGVCTIRLSTDGGETISEESYDLAEGNPIRLPAKLERPGFISCFFKGVDKFNVHARATAGFDVEKIRQGYPEPADFDAYWAGLLKRQSEIPDAVLCEPLPDSAGKPGYHYFKLTITTIDDGRVYGFLGIPSGRPGPFAGIVLICGAGSGYDAPDPTFIRPDVMTLSLNIHPIDPTMPKDEFKRRYQEMTAEKPYWLLGAPDRELYHFRNGIVGCCAAVNFLASHPQFNGKDLFYLSASQGGGFGLILGGLEPRFTAIAASVPALCDLGGIAAGRTSGWPQVVEKVAGSDEKLKQRCLKMSAYFDAVNFAKRIQCPVIFTVGFNDMTCWPGPIYAAYNAVKSPKWIMTAPLASHTVPWEHLNGTWQWVQNGMDEKDRRSRDYFKY